MKPPRYIARAEMLSSQYSMSTTAILQNEKSKYLTNKSVINEFIHTHPKKLHASRTRMVNKMKDLGCKSFNLSTGGAKDLYLYREKRKSHAMRRTFRLGC